MALKANPMKEALKQGRTQIGTWLNLIRNPAVLSLLKTSGLDYARVDMEHSAPSIETIADMAVVARALDFPITVRPPEGNREWITRLLDVGVWNLHIPQVDNPKIAEEVVKASRYAPLGMRGMSAVGPHTEFDSMPDLRSQLAFINEQVHITVMFESRESFRHVDEIVSMPGIDAVTLGPSDLAQELGVLGTPSQAKVIDEHRERLIEAARAHHKDVAMLVQTLDEAERWIKAGVKIIAYSSEVAVLKGGFSAAARRLKG